MFRLSHGEKLRMGISREVVSDEYTDWIMYSFRRLIMMPSPFVGNAQDFRG
jgi:hypothetical protein